MRCSPAADAILVTGAAGFIGSAVVAGLAATGRPVRAGVRGARIPRVLPPSATPTPCDLDAAAAVRAAVAGVGLVVHAAVGAPAKMAAQCATLLDAMTAAGTTALIYLSSVAVYGGRTGAIDETTPPAPLDAYGAAKAGCERLVRAWADAEPHRRALILRPGIVYGTGSRFWIDKLAERIAVGAWGRFDAAQGRAALVHVDDVVALIGVAAERLTAAETDPRLRCATLNVVGPDTPRWNGYFAALAARIGTPELRRIGRGELWLRQAGLMAKIWRRLGLPGGRRLALAPLPGEIALFARDASYATAAATDLLGFTATIGLAEGLARTAVPHPAG
ncbi:NAD-dependent epimerase/dehydratase family protein [Blastochloris viridis]|uniref:Cholesterol dehydrogenase n=1 Tax=Blastochloris viridis TaxID=1079 RepID=A0A0H5BDE1_BLAVI|nr:NAD(P)-dependent oxidoreductase [Blastochloris viridis]ALK10903.1 ADP-L-glycero-D-manno-heptose-6-epimerase [Blastochloris viridis]BAR99119.1 UDP-glucose 4-epimerase [Blastochloris viridis]CUU43565.1 Cholesterol dehydrogenase [Blastochloris viridis]